MSAAIAESEAPQVSGVVGDDGAQRVELSGRWNLQSLERRLPQLVPRLAELARAQPAPEWDLRRIAIIDHAGAMLLWRAWGKRRASRVVLKPEHELLFKHLALPSEALPPAPA